MPGAEDEREDRDERDDRDDAGEAEGESQDASFSVSGTLDHEEDEYESEAAAGAESRDRDRDGRGRDRGRDRDRDREGGESGGGVDAGVYKVTAAPATHRWELCGTCRKPFAKNDLQLSFADRVRSLSLLAFSPHALSPDLSLPAPSLPLISFDAFFSVCRCFFFACV